MSSVTGMFGDSKNPLLMKCIKVILNIAYCGAALTAIVFEGISLGKAADAVCPDDGDKDDFTHDKGLFIAQTTIYILDDLRNCIDGIMNLVDIFQSPIPEGSSAEGAQLPAAPSCASKVKTAVFGVRAILSELYALGQMAFGITLVALP